jgi:hypothetical protein
MIAPWKRGCPFTVVKSSGIARIPATEHPPEDCPNMVTLFGLPPNEPIFV